jgi:hypothetical protein
MTYMHALMEHSSDYSGFPLQKVWQLAGPVLVAHASIEEELEGKSPEAKDAVRSRTWWKVLETTRHLLAHPSITDTDDLFKIVLVNLRALLYAARVDITTHRKWKFLDSETTVSFKEPGGAGKIWVDKIIAVLLARLKNCTVSELRDDFDNTTSTHEALLKKCRLIFGHVAFRLKARDDDAWKVAASEFKVL